MSLYVASIEDVVVSKLEWAQQGQSRRHIEDVAALLRMHWNSLELGYVQKWISELGILPEWGEAKQSAGISD
jgi:hypothetical protein